MNEESRLASLHALISDTASILNPTISHDLALGARAVRVRVNYATFIALQPRGSWWRTAHYTPDENGATRSEVYEDRGSTRNDDTVLLAALFSWVAAESEPQIDFSTGFPNPVNTWNGTMADWSSFLDVFSYVVARLDILANGRPGGLRQRLALSGARSVARKFWPMLVEDDPRLYEYAIFRGRKLAGEQPVE
ncbi:hypothetical protein ACH0AH_12900 [Microbacterium paludicola]|uniref:hypothetical protein n=1 Tax=Microbacterium paludicola TaxID=300019 RepID=UPI0038795486